jgi:hypothetical protein
MKFNWLKSLFQKERPVLYMRPGQSEQDKVIPVWLARDLGLDNPENLKAVETGGCRNSEAGYRPSTSKRPGHS